MHEQTHLFGAHDHLIGTLTCPDIEPTRDAPRAGAGAAPRVGALLLNAGVVHRIGPHRINVKLARAFAGAGMPALRIDLAAVGDSRAPPVDTAYDRQAVIDMRAAIDLLVAQTGVANVALLGICSGAVHALHCALADQRVNGVVMIDGYAYPTVRTRRERWMQRMRTIDRATVARSLRARVAGMRADRTAGRALDAPSDLRLANPPREALADDLLVLLRRQVSIYQIFSGSILQHYNYAGQFQDAFAEWPDLARIRTEYLPEIDHTITTLEAQADIIERLRTWMSSL